MSTETRVFDALDGADNNVHAIATLGALAHGAELLTDGEIYAVVNAEGGMLAWQAAGKQMVSETGEEPSVR